MKITINACNCAMFIATQMQHRIVVLKDKTVIYKEKEILELVREGDKVHISRKVLN